ncbi:hypothetical protein A3B93_00345 [Candidatus Nomurabacteria bacterium RIFCSPHIGHO2_02_FULL_42_24]|uniref:Type II secretion system protein GspF domain-containing protein n=1 Tax=Candidatus Nomurabacteria bacterium RIFCSPHIGHO2_02_FULL_42_24 TaxID=1801757 RepID=A0A1F6WHQ8_9BACT|nr:MAG: hypothetical protein A3B93_00345 [Candidatus Nomurabacteria bacterium RIFCSPHIGHO2_02_FULL_42_24]
MLFYYKALSEKGEKKEGTVNAINKDLAVNALQRRGLIVVSLREEEEKTMLKMAIFEKVSLRDVVMLSRQISTLFEAEISPLRAFSLMAANVENPLLRRKLEQVTDDLQAGFSISNCLAKHPEIFSEFYVGMVKAGEESGKLNQIFSFLADHMDRQYEITSKTKNALIYPIFVVFIFFAVMIMMFTMVIPKMTEIIQESGQAVPFFTRVVIGLSGFFVNYGIFLLILVILGGFALFYFGRGQAGKVYFDRLKITTPVVKNLFRNMYLSRIADNLNTLLSSGVPVIRALEITANVVGNRLYTAILQDAMNAVKAGSSISDALARHEEIPSIMSQMIKVGEETGALTSILKTVSNFYRREVEHAVNTLISFIEPILILFLGVGVAILVAAILVPIYQITISMGQ